MIFILSVVVTTQTLFYWDERLTFLRDKNIANYFILCRTMCATLEAAMVAVLACCEIFGNIRAVFLQFFPGAENRV